MTFSSAAADASSSSVAFEDVVGGFEVDDDADADTDCKDEGCLGCDAMLVVVDEEGGSLLLLVVGGDILMRCQRCVYLAVVLMAENFQTLLRCSFRFLKTLLYLSLCEVLVLRKEVSDENFSLAGRLDSFGLRSLF